MKQLSLVLQWILISETGVSGCFRADFWRAAWVQLSLLNCTASCLMPTPACPGPSGGQHGWCHHSSSETPTALSRKRLCSTSSRAMVSHRTGHRTDLHSGPAPRKKVYDPVTIILWAQPSKELLAHLDPHPFRLQIPNLDTWILWETTFKSLAKVYMNCTHIIKAEVNEIQCSPCIHSCGHCITEGK